MSVEYWYSSYLVVTRQSSCDVHVGPKEDVNTVNRTKCFTENVLRMIWITSILKVSVWNFTISTAKNQTQALKRHFLYQFKDPKTNWK